MDVSEHHYSVAVDWTGNRGSGTSGYRAYGRDHTVSAAAVPTLLGSADRTFHGDANRWNPELLLLAALTQCHMLSYLHVAASAGVVVTGYSDAAQGTMVLHADGSGEFTSVTLHPVVTVAEPNMSELANSLHEDAAAKCFIARSVNFPVHHRPTARA